VSFHSSSFLTLIFIASCTVRNLRFVWRVSIHITLPLKHL
jgi:hypothetical protein